jgi:hypothetical protein
MAHIAPLVVVLGFHDAGLPYGNSGADRSVRT